jgi:hypothetical protein
VEGPEFDGHLVNYELLMARLSAFREEEREALQMHGAKELHRCPIEEVLLEKEVE